MYYPVAVMSVAVGILILMMLFIVPRFQQVFAGLLDGAALPTFTTFILRLSEIIRHHAIGGAILVVALGFALAAALHTSGGRWLFAQLKL